MPHEVVLDGATLTLDTVVAVASGGARVAFAEGAMERMRTGRAVVEDLVARGVPAYGITTGFGSQKDFTLDGARMAEFNRRVLIGHATFAPGSAAPDRVLRAAAAIQLNLFATGRSGVRPELSEKLLDRLNDGARMPKVVSGSSLGASDIVSLSQLGLPLADGLAAKEAMSLMNSNAFTLAQAALALDDLGRLFGAWDVAAALSLEGFRGHPGAWSEGVNRARPHTAGPHLRALLRGSRLLNDGEPRFLQDPLSFRCVPQIHGAGRAVWDWTKGVVETELNAPVDNPMIDPQAGAVVSHGAMETTLLAVAFDALRLAAAKMSQASGERVHKLQWPNFSGLPTGLAAAPGAIGGVQFLNLGHIAAAKVATATHAAMPASLHYHGQVCDGVEDVAGLAPHAVEATERLAEAAWTVLTVEAVTACWALARRGLTADQIGEGLRTTFDSVTPKLPIGREGEEPFDLGPIQAAIRAQAPPLAL